MDKHYVAIVFRYADDIMVSRGNKLPPDWKHQVYTPTWDIVFALFKKLAEIGKISSEGSGDLVVPKEWDITEEQELVKQFNENQLAEIKDSYACLYSKDVSAMKAKNEEEKTWQPDNDLWRYRLLLKERLSIFEHFRGTGRAQNEIEDPKNLPPHNKGFVERIGPNRRLRDLPEGEVAIIHLGKLKVSTEYAPFAQ